MVLAIGEVFFPAADGIGWEDVGSLDVGFWNFAMSNFHIFCFLSFSSGAGAGGLVGVKLAQHQASQA